MKRRVIHKRSCNITNSIHVSKHGRPRTNNSFELTITDPSDLTSFDEIEEFRDYIIEAAEPDAVDPTHIWVDNFIASLSPSVLEAGLEKWGDDFLFFLKGLGNSDNFANFIRDNAYSSNVFPEYAHKTMHAVKDILDNLNLKGLEVKVTTNMMTIHYDNFNPDIYDVDSQEHLDNWHKLIDFCKSISCVIDVYDTYRYEGRQVYANLVVEANPGDISYGAIPKFEEIPRRTDTNIVYKVTYVGAPDYFVDQRSKFHRTASNELYVVHNYTFELRDDSVDSFINKIYPSKFSEKYSFRGWNDYLTWLGNEDFSGNGLVLDTQIVKIVRSQEGKSKTIFNRELPK